MIPNCKPLRPSICEGGRRWWNSFAFFFFFSIPFGRSDESLEEESKEGIGYVLSIVRPYPD